MDRDRGTLRAVIACGCGERPVPIAVGGDALLAPRIPYEPAPDLRNARRIWEAAAAQAG